MSKERERETLFQTSMTNLTMKRNVLSDRFFFFFFFNVAAKKPALQRAMGGTKNKAQHISYAIFKSN